MPEGVNPDLTAAILTGPKPSYGSDADHERDMARLDNIYPSLSSRERSGTKETF